MFRLALSLNEGELEAFQRYADLLQRWSGAINLVARSTLGDVWRRHFLDSAQLVELVGNSDGTWVDLGSGAGFPGLVVAILAKRRFPDMSVTLIEADQRKAAFLRSVSRETSTPVRIIADRVERVPPLGARIVSARAFAPLPDLLDHASRHLAPGGVCLFPKGRNFRSEIERARKEWHFTCEAIPSRVEDDAAILKIGEIERA
ncbi:16S rRNA (guanine527-N7)-methyltransferase [Meinhardsimonia xiamenensis]|jgi:16S rRNA (guanine527-N7)-methyltransferase|uniref:Ribosomal RNA small subunit methyltransferase G n=2 Tax=Meinhardsimonia xiamenensis TaxID=990712 RepID=A0A1G8Y7B9_9RHOB|nr:16S rRNA (guanine(527)-N(7))-methyltransferase RsmG [Meinhardsimonia xiamenensis]PRX37174.1 16S rRNA (guanine527-N7)-methyltransferase [Meinhardsimonia xiamenensis]SDJ98085.1 16S rRNA (guanine527-N7)-methyltransferase [Meinhardsimonia xiamenensis]